MRIMLVLRFWISYFASLVHRPISRIRIGTAQLPMLCLVLALPALAADDLQSPDGGHTAGNGSISLSYQNIVVNEFNTSVSEVDIGEVQTHALYLEGTYALTDRWTLTAGLPYIKKRYIGAGVHDPLTLVPPRPEVPLIDDGNYHSEFQDFYLGVSYLWISDPVIVEPFARLEIPSHDYPHFANAAIGQNLWKAEIGIEVIKLMPFSDWYFRAETSYTFVEETLGVSVNHFRLNTEVGYFFNDAFSAKWLVLAKHGRGNDATLFPPSNRTGEPWFQHDRTTRHSYVNTGVGANWYFHDNYQLSGSVITSVWGSSVHLVDVAWGMSLTRYF
jgi:outer membrane receptor protein involved in Fe transport